MSIWSAAVIYFGFVFAAGFVLGAVRVTQLTPSIGSIPATVIELPIMLAVSWWVARGPRATLTIPNQQKI